MKNKLQKTAPAWHADAVTLLNENFGKIDAAFTDATKRAVWMGMFLNHVKARGKGDGSIPHGTFGPWLKKNVPDLGHSQINVYMSLAVGVCEKGEFQITDFGNFADIGHLPPKIEKLIEGQTQSQLFLSFKQAEADEDGNLKPKIGRVKGEGGRPSMTEGNIEEIVRLRVKHSMRHAGLAADNLEALAVDFMGCPDDFNTALLGALERSAKCLRAWLNTPTPKRDMQEILKLWKTL